MNCIDARNGIDAIFILYEFNCLIVGALIGARLNDRICLNTYFLCDEKCVFKFVRNACNCVRCTRAGVR